MPRKLSEVMREIVGGWHADLPPSWQGVLEGVDPDCDAIDAELELEPWEPVFPARKGKRFPGAPAGAHMLCAFDGIGPSSVRAVVLGQDPYPEPACATGRAFEIGGVRQWRDLDRMFSPSVRAYTLSVLAARLGRPDLAGSFADWPKVLGMIESGDIAVESHEAISDRHEAQGVLLLNASLTLSRFHKDIDPHQSRGHLRLWRPVILAVLRHVVAANPAVVFIGFGDAARDLLHQSGVASDPRHHVVECPHPAFADAFLSHPNPFSAANAHLASRGEQPINW